MKKLLLLALVALGGVMNASAWNNLYFLCSDNNWAQNESYNFTKVNDNAFYYILDAEDLKTTDVIFRIKDTSSDWGAWENEAVVGSTEYSANKDEVANGFKVLHNANAKFAYIYANYKQDPSNNYEWRWHLTANIIEETTTVAFVDIDKNWKTAKAYAWLTNEVKLLGEWPGTQMNKVGDIYTLEIPYVSGAKIKFTDKNEGGNESSNFDMEENAIYKYDSKVENVSASVTSATGYATFSSAYPLDFSAATNIRAYTVSNLSSTSATLTQVTEVPAGTGLIIKGSGSANIPTKIVTGSVGTNYLQAAVAATTVNGGEAYVLSNGEFHPANAGTIPAGKAYLKATDIPANARSLSLMFDDATGIGTLQTVSVEDNVFYNLGGQRVAAPTKGMYIVNGKKVIIK